MKFSLSITPNAGRSLVWTRLAVASISLVVLLIFAANTAIAQTDITPTTTTTQIAIAAGPLGGIVLPSTHINPVTGRPERHLWYGDGGAGGFCRIDPDLDSTGTHALNSTTCITTLNNVSVNAGPAAYDPITGSLYFVDLQRSSQGVFLLQYDPNGDGGHGSVAGGLELAGNPPGGKASGSGCPFPGTPTPLTPDALALGPDGNLWMGFKKGGQILRIKNPSNFDGNCAASVEIVATTPDNKITNGLAWIGHDLYGADGTSPFVIPNADTACNPTCTPTSILPQIGGITAVVSDQTYPLLNGNNLYFGTTVDVEWLGNVTDPINQTLAVAYGGNTFLNVGGLALDANDPANLTVFVGDDPLGLGLNGEWYQVIQTAATPAAPGTPTDVVATSKLPNQATVSWSPAQTGQPVDNYTVHNSFASNGILHADVIVGQGVGIKGAATSVVITGLTNSVSYRFTVTANNANGSSAPSAESNTVTPLAFTVPDAPTDAAATAGDGGALVNWVASASNGGQPITSYTVSALVGGIPTGLTVNVAPNVTSVFFTGLTNGTTYSFTIHATNSVGNSAESLQSNAVTPTVGALAPDMSVTMSGPSTANFGTQVSYTATIHNTGSSPAFQVVVSDSLVGAGASLIAAVPGQGSCTVTPASISCNLGTMQANATTTIVYIALLGNAGVTNQASVLAKDPGGITFIDATPVNNTASVTTTVNTGGNTTTSTDLQLTGSASNGGPNVNTAINYIWQVRDAQSTQASNVLFVDTLPASLQFNSVTTTLGTCTGPAVGSLGGTVSCSIPKLGGSAQGGTKPTTQFTVTVNVTVRQTGSIANPATVSFLGTDTAPANNSATVTINAR